MGFEKFNRTCNCFQSRTVFSQHWWALLYCIPHVLISQGLYLWTNLQDKERHLGIRLETSNICEYNQERATSPSLYEELEPNQDNLDIHRKQLQDIGSMYVSKSIVHRTSNTSPGAVTGSEVVVGCFKVKFHGANQAPWSKTLFWLHGLQHGHWGLLRL